MFLLLDLPALSLLYVIYTPCFYLIDGGVATVVSLCGKLASVHLPKQIKKMCPNLGHISNHVSVFFPYLLCVYLR